MSQDNKLRCVVAYRLPRGDVKDSGVVVAKYDYASQYESRGGSGSLYGGKDKNYADAVAMVVGKDPPGRVGGSSKIGGFKVVESEVHHVVYGADNDGICLAVIAGSAYKSRVLIKMMTELYGEFNQKFGNKALSATANSMTGKTKSMLYHICKKYADVKKVDAASGVLDQVDAVKGTMATNISSMLKNVEKADAINQQTEELNEAASVFKKRGGDLKNKMWWADLKQTLILSVIVLTVVGLFVYKFFF